MNNKVTLKRKYENYLCANNMKKVYFDKTKLPTGPLEFDFINLEEKKYESNSEATQDNNLITEDPLSIPPKNKSSHLDSENLEKLNQSNVVHFHMSALNRLSTNTREKCSMNASFDKNKKLKKHASNNNLVKNLIITSQISNESISSPKGIHVDQSLTNIYRPNNLKILNAFGSELCTSIKNEPSLFVPTLPTEAQNLKNELVFIKEEMPVSFETNEDVDHISSSKLDNNNSKNYIMQNINQKIKINPELSTQHENDSQYLFSPRIDNIFTTDQDSFESGFDFGEKSLLNKINCPEKLKNQSAFKKSCEICSLSFNSEDDWLTHILSIEHENLFLSFKEKLGIPSSLNSIPVKKPLKTTKLLLENKADTFKPISYVPVNLLNRRIVLYGSIEYPDKDRNSNSGHECHCKNETKENLQKKTSKKKDCDDLSIGTKTDIPVIFIPYQVRVKSSTNSKSKVVLMYLPHFDIGTSQSFMEESWLLPSNSWIGEAVDPVQEKLDVVFNGKNKRLCSEISVSHVVAPGDDKQPQSSKPCELIKEHSLLTNKKLPVSRDERSSSNNNASDTEDCITNLCLPTNGILDENKAKELSLTHHPFEMQEKLTLIKSCITKENNSASVTQDISCNTAEISLMNGEIENTVKEKISKADKPKTSKNIEEYTSFNSVPNNNENQKTCESYSLPLVANQEKDGEIVRTNLDSSSNIEKKKSSMFIFIKVLKDVLVDKLEQDNKLPLRTEENVCSSSEEKKISTTHKNTDKIKDLKTNSMMDEVLFKGCDSQTKSITECTVKKNHTKFLTKRKKISKVKSTRLGSPRTNFVSGHNEKVLSKNTNDQNIGQALDGVKFNGKTDLLILDKNEDILVEDVSQSNVSDYAKLLNESLEELSNHSSGYDDQINSSKSEEDSLHNERLDPAFIATGYLNSNDHKKVKLVSPRLLANKNKILYKKKEKLAILINGQRKKRKNIRKEKLLRKS